MKDSAILATALAVIALGCGGGSDNPTQPTGNNGFTVSVVNNAFSPATITVPVGSTVTWQWNSDGVTHNVTFQDGTTSGNMNSGSFPRTFQAAGTFPYLCTIHGSLGMTGTVTVTAASGQTGSGSGTSGGSGGGSGGSGMGGGGAYP
jgi:plastocyanin